MAVAPGYDEAALTGVLGIPWLLTVRSAQTTSAPVLELTPHVAVPLPEPLAVATQLTLTATRLVTASFPAGAQAQEQDFRFFYNGAQITTLRVYTPITATVGAALPTLFMVYPTQVDLWQQVSTAYASQGFALIAISPIAERAVNIDAHAQDARVALTLALQGKLNMQVRGGQVIALGGSFSSAILHRLLRDEGDHVAGWVTVGGISNAFSGTADFYAGRLLLPAQYEYLIPALGQPHIYPLPFLRFSPVYTAAQLPPTLIIHTDVDHVIPIDQAYQLEAALRAAQVPVEVYYYRDVSHYLQIDEGMTDAGRSMFLRVADFARRWLAQ